MTGNRSQNLSPIQQGMLYHHETFPGRGYDMEQIHMVLRESLDAPRFRGAWEWLTERHPALRRSVSWSESKRPVQVEADAALDFRWTEADERNFSIETLLEEDRQEGFDLRQSPLSRVRVVQLGPEHSEVIWSFHHILFDGRSFPRLLTELFGQYEGLEASPPEEDVFPEHLEFLASRRWDQGAADFWKQQLSGLCAPTPLPLRPLRSWSESALPDRLTPHQRRVSLDVETTERLQLVAAQRNVGINTLLQGAWALVLSRFTGTSDIVFGATRACRRGGVEGASGAVGVFINSLPVRANCSPELTVETLVQQIRADDLATRAHEHCPLVEVQSQTDLPPGSHLFETNIVFDTYLLGERLRENGPTWNNREFELHESAPFALTLYGNLKPELILRLAFDESRFSPSEVQWLLDAVAAALESFARPSGFEEPLHAIPVLREAGAQVVLRDWNRTDQPLSDATIPAAFAAQVQATPDLTALIDGDREFTFSELAGHVDRLAAQIGTNESVEQTVVGLCAERSCELIIGALAIMKSGAAYLPLDPAYPRERLVYMLQDSKAKLVVGDRNALDLASTVGAEWVDLADVANTPIEDRQPAPSPSSSTPSDLAYVIYTSGSTGLPKGVMVEHRNVLNFFTAMDELVPSHAERTWLAVTSLSFDISVLEIFWTLCRGTKVVLGAELGAQRASAGPAFSLLYFAAGEGVDGDPYRLLLEGAKFADAHGFEAVWVPERHFHEFGGLFPNPSVAAAAVASCTEDISIRAGSVVSPLHHPARIAEEWSMVDNLSKGRVGLSFASGWHPNDFALRPESFEDRRNQVARDIETVRELWRGDSVAFSGPRGEVSLRTLPRPVQPELPVWLTTAGNPETYRQAGEVGANILTHLLGQTTAEVADNLRIYRQARTDAGHPGNGRATLMLHTFLADTEDQARDTAREPMKQYLKSSLGLIRGFASEWSAFKRGAEQDVSLEDLDSDEMDALLEYSFERYASTSALFGTVSQAAAMVEELYSTGIDEIACLIDFGVQPETVLESLPYIDQLKQESRQAVRHVPIPELIREHRVTHMQCTPSLARILTVDEDSKGALGELEVLLVGGEPLPPHLAAELGQTVPRVFNMYGPTETTIWSTVHELPPGGPSGDEVIPIGRPVANTTSYVFDQHLQPVAPGVVGELYLGGKGVVRGYWERPELTQERFITSTHALDEGHRPGRLYRTGDLVRWSAEGVLLFEGRADFQVKLRGHRIELGEIESCLASAPSVQDAVVVLREDRPEDQRLVAYVTALGGTRPEEQQLRDLVRRNLPEIMVPAGVQILEELPLTPNGKIDRNRLQEADYSPDESSGELSPRDNSVSAAQAATDSEGATTPASAPTSDPHQTLSPSADASLTDLRGRIAAIWSDVLGGKEVGINANFFDLGGHSLLAVRAHRELRKSVSEKLQMTDLFRFPTVRTLAEHASTLETVPPARAAQTDGQFPKETAGVGSRAGTIEGQADAPHVPEETASQRRARLRRQRRQGGRS